tara:strand:+ start:1174 stop:1455 length:282 start_codon:yes stop_codon:yes gene_type:complete
MDISIEKAKALFLTEVCRRIFNEHTMSQNVYESCSDDCIYNLKFKSSLSGYQRCISDLMGWSEESEEFDNEIKEFINAYCINLTRFLKAKSDG